MALMKNNKAGIKNSEEIIDYSHISDMSSNIEDRLLDNWIESVANSKRLLQSSRYFEVAATNPKQIKFAGNISLFTIFNLKRNLEEIIG